MKVKRCARKQQSIPHVIVMSRRRNNAPASVKISGEGEIGREEGGRRRGAAMLKKRAFWQVVAIRCC